MLHLRITASWRRQVASFLICLSSVLPITDGALGGERAGRLVAGNAGQGPTLLFSSSEIGLGTLYPAHLDLVQRYVSSMTLYSLAPNENDLKAKVLTLNWVGTDRLPDAFRLVWAAPNGNLIARIGRGLFRISSGNYRANFFRNVDCQLMNWSGGEIEAAVSCSDGKDRSMLVPGNGLLVIDNVQYRRIFPMDEQVTPGIEPE
jgi:hypothetical protein